VTSMPLFTSTQPPLCCRYFLLTSDALSVQVRQDGLVPDQVVHWALGSADGALEVLGLWPEPASGFANGPEIFDDLRARGVERIRFAATNDLTALRAAYPGATMLPAVGRVLRESLAQVAPRDRESVAPALSAFRDASTERSARALLARLSATPSASKYPDLIDRWQSLLPQLAPYFALPPRLRQIVLRADEGVQWIRVQLVRAVGRHGQFDDRDAAISFLEEVLGRAGQKLIAGQRS